MAAAHPVTWSSHYWSWLWIFLHWRWSIADRPYKRPNRTGISFTLTKFINKLWLVYLWLEKQHLVIRVIRHQNPQRTFSVLFQSNETVIHNHKPENPLEGSSQKAVKKTLEYKKKRLCVTELVTPTLGHQDEDERLSVFSCPVIFLAGL